MIVVFLHRFLLSLYKQLLSMKDLRALHLVTR